MTEHVVCWSIFIGLVLMTVFVVGRLSDNAVGEAICNLYQPELYEHGDGYCTVRWSSQKHDHVFTACESVAREKYGELKRYREAYVRAIEQAKGDSDE